MHSAHGSSSACTACGSKNSTRQGRSDNGILAWHQQQLRMNVRCGSCFGHQLVTSSMVGKPQHRRWLLRPSKLNLRQRRQRRAPSLQLFFLRAAPLVWVDAHPDWRLPFCSFGTTRFAALTGAPAPCARLQRACRAAPQLRVGCVRPKAARPQPESAAGEADCVCSCPRECKP